MLNKTESYEITSCYHNCPFFGTDGGGPGTVMLCQHPKFTLYEGAIITHDNSRDRVPDECPLRESPITITKLVKLKSTK